MRRFFRFVIFALLAGSSLAVADDKIPSNWLKAGSEPDHYEMGTASVGDRRVAYIRPAIEDPQPFGTLMQMINADDYKSERIRLSATVKTIGVLHAAMWMRIDGRRKPSLQFDNMDNRPIVGDTGWTRYSIVLDVPRQAQKIAFGVFSSGKGEVLFDDFSLEVVDQSVPSTNMLNQTSKPENLDFEN